MARTIGSGSGTGRDAARPGFGAQIRRTFRAGIGLIAAGLLLALAGWATGGALDPVLPWTAHALVLAGAVALVFGVAARTWNRFLWRRAVRDSSLTFLGIRWRDWLSRGPFARFWRWWLWIDAQGDDLP
ncbi:MAG: hypothetical protein IT542_01055 [Rubellimicrobium sp.]|nr:hypothetical protein [Rubellimicrobium sp.]